MRRPPLILLILLATSVMVGADDAVSIAPAGFEFRVNTYTTGAQREGSTAGFANGGNTMIVTWESLDQDGSQHGVVAQRYTGASIPVGPEFRVNTYTTADQIVPDVAVDQPGNFVVVWQSENQDGDDRGIYGQRYTSGGLPSGSEFRVNTYTTGGQTFPDVAKDSSGNFVVVWASAGQDGSSDGVFGQRYAATGAPLGPEFQVNTYATGAQRFPAVAFADAGNFVVVWEGYSPSDQFFGVFGQRYSGAGVPLGGEFRVNTYTTGNQRYPAVAGGFSGFVVTWQSGGQDGSGYGVFAQRYATAGLPAGVEFRVNGFTTNNQSFPAAAAHLADRYMISWQSEGQDGSGPGIFMQIFNSGVPETPLDNAVNTYTPGAQTAPAVTHDPIGFMVVWTSLQDPDGTTGVYSFRYFDFPVELQTFTVE